MSYTTCGARSLKPAFKLTFSPESSSGAGDGGVSAGSNPNYDGNSVSYPSGDSISWNPNFGIGKKTPSTTDNPDNNYNILNIPSVSNNQIIIRDLNHRIFNWGHQSDTANCPTPKLGWPKNSGGIGFDFVIGTDFKPSGSSEDGILKVSISGFKVEINTQLYAVGVRFPVIDDVTEPFSVFNDTSYTPTRTANIVGSINQHAGYWHPGTSSSKARFTSTVAAGDEPYTAASSGNNLPTSEQNPTEWDNLFSSGSKDFEEGDIVSILVFNSGEKTTIEGVTDWFGSSETTIEVYVTRGSNIQKLITAKRMAPPMFGFTSSNLNLEISKYGASGTRTNSDKTLKSFSMFYLPDNLPATANGVQLWEHVDPPTMTITAANASTSINSGGTTSDTSITATFTVVFEGSATTTNFVASDISVTNGTISNFSGSGSTYTATFTPSASLFSTPNTITATTISVGAGAFTVEGKNNSATDTFTWNVRSVKPIPNVNYTNTNRNSGGIRQLIDDYISDSTVAKFTDATQDTYYGPIEQWDTSEVTNMSNAFNGVSNASTQNYDISNWDTSSVTSMENMFYNNDGFNRDIGSWDVSNVENMHSMFYGCAIFNQNLGSWDVSSVTKMRLMFVATNDFNNGGSDSIKNWDVSSVTGDDGFQQMFQSAAKFNQPINDWDVSSGTNFANMFNSADDFIQLLPDWDMSNATNTDFMFTEYTGDNTSGTANTNGSMSNYLSLLDGSLSIVSNRINYVAAAKVAFYSPTQTNYLGANIGNNPDTTFPTITIAAGYGSNALIHLISGITTTSTTNFAASIAQTSTNVYEEQGASATDNVNSNMTVTVGGDTVDTTVTGTYVVTYTANDNYNVRVRTKTITVTDDYTPFKSGMTMKSNAIRGLYNSVCRAAIGFATSGNIQIKTHEDVVGFTIDGNNGRFGSGTASPEETFHSTSCKINETVSVVQLTGASDRRLKTDIQNIDDSRGIYDLEPVQYNWERNPDGSVHFGFIAQELKKRYPNLVKVDSTGLHSIDYLGLVPLMIKELKGQFEKVEKLTDEMKYLKDLLDNVE